MDLNYFNGFYVSLSVKYKRTRYTTLKEILLKLDYP